MSDFVRLDLFAVRFLFGEAWAWGTDGGVAVSRRAFERHLVAIFRARSLDWFRRKAAA